MAMPYTLRLPVRLASTDFKQKLRRSVHVGKPEYLIWQAQPLAWFETNLSALEASKHVQGNHASCGVCASPSISSVFTRIARIVLDLRSISPQFLSHFIEIRMLLERKIERMDRNKKRAAYR
jgi:hypothetical protein